MGEAGRGPAGYTELDDVRPPLDIGPDPLEQLGSVPHADPAEVADASGDTKPGPCADDSGAAPPTGFDRVPEAQVGVAQRAEVLDRGEPGPERSEERRVGKECR